MVVKRVRFQKIDYVEPVSSTLARVGHSEVEPLVVGLGQVVWLQNQVILKLIHLDCSPQVPRLYSRLKAQGIIGFGLRLIKVFENG